MELRKIEVELSHILYEFGVSRELYRQDNRASVNITESTCGYFDFSFYCTLNFVLTDEREETIEEKPSGLYWRI